MSTLAGTDAFVVNRGGVNYQVTAANFMSTVLDTDLFVVNRGAVNYKVTGLDVKNYFGPSGGGSGFYELGSVSRTTSSGSGIGYSGAGSVWFDGSKYYASRVVPCGTINPSSHHGFQVSSDGLNFTPVPRSGGPYVDSVIVAPDGNLLGIGTTEANTSLLFTGAGLINVYKSTDQGVSWSQVLAGPGAASGSVQNQMVLNVDSTNTKVAVYGGNTNTGASLFYESSDSGSTWITATGLGFSSGGGGMANSVIGVGGNWYFVANDGSTRVRSIPQGSSGATVPTTYLATLATSINSLSYGNNFFMVGSPASVKTYDSSFTLISSVSPAVPASVQYSGNWVNSAGKMFAGVSNPGTSTVTQYLAPIYISAAGGISDVTSLQKNGTGSITNYFYSLGTDVYTGGTGTAFIFKVYS